MNAVDSATMNGVKFLFGSGKWTLDVKNPINRDNPLITSVPPADGMFSNTTTGNLCDSVISNEFPDFKDTEIPMNRSNAKAASPSASNVGIPHPPSSVYNCAVVLRHAVEEDADDDIESKLVGGDSAVKVCRGGSQSVAWFNVDGWV